MLRLFYCDQHAIPLPVGHKFPMRKYAMLRELLSAAGWFRLEAAPFAARDGDCPPRSKHNRSTLFA